eukprot:2173266-Pyramimonas_sp.AAC.1
MFDCASSHCDTRRRIELKPSKPKKPVQERDGRSSGVECHLGLHPVVKDKGEGTVKVGIVWRKTPRSRVAMARFPGRQMFRPGAASFLQASVFPHTSSWAERASNVERRILPVSGLLYSNVRAAHKDHFSPPTYANSDSPNVYTKREPETVTPWCRHVVSG